VSNQNTLWGGQVEKSRSHITQSLGFRGGRWSVALLTATALFAAACGDDKGTSSDTTTAVETTTATTAAPTTAAPTTAAVTTAASATTVASTATTTVATAATSTSAKATTAAITSTTTMPTTTTVAATTTTGVVKPTKSEVLIGVSLAVTGANSALSKNSPDVVNAWVAWVNTEMGGINGHPVRALIRDTRADPATAGAIANEFIDAKVLAEVGGYDSSTDAGWVKTLTDAKIPVIGGSSAAVWNATVGAFNVTTASASQAGASVVAAKAAGGTTFGMVLSAGSPAAAGAAPLIRAAADQVGIPVGGQLFIAAADPFYTAACLSMQSAGVDALLLGVASDVGTRVIDDCAKQGYRPQFIASGGTVDGALAEVSKGGTSFAGQIASFPWWVSTPAVKNYRDVMAKYAPGKEYRNHVQSTAWASLELFRKAMSNASDNPTAAETLAALYTIKNESLGGLIASPVTYRSGEKSPPIGCFFVYKLTNGTFGGGITACYP
jgi:branched-chain amino acid transport system substrate-binding protein